MVDELYVVIMQNLVIGLNVKIRKLETKYGVKEEIIRIEVKIKKSK